MVLSTFFYGLRMDLSMAAYFSLLPFILIASVQIGVKKEMVEKIIRFYSISLIVFVSLLVVIDMELFSFWGYRLDGTPLKYMDDTPGEVMASGLSSPLYIILPVFVILIVGGMFVYKKIFQASLSSAEFSTSKPRSSFAMLAGVILLLIIPIRGGLQMIPLNESSVYFCNSNLCNQSTLNLPWTFFHSLLEKSYSDHNPYAFTDEANAQATVKDLYGFSGNDSTSSLIRDSTCNLVVILWESFTAKADVDSVTPEFNKLKKEGIYFSNIYATGDRSDKGIIGVLSGYPSQPVTSIIMNPNKSVKLPSISQVMKSRGYRTAYYYGGDMEFANMRTFMLAHQFDRLIGNEDFSDNEKRGTWGVHDEVVYKRLKRDLDTMKAPFFSMIFTLSSHEPFDVPVTPKFPAKKKRHLFLSSLNYADKCLGDFIREAKKSSWWNNTVIVIIADHGHVLPGSQYAQHKPNEFHIPMLWLGGALAKQDTVINKIASQTDLPATLLAQYGISSGPFYFSRNIMAQDYRQFAYYSFHDGFGYIKPEGFFYYDNVSGRVIRQSGVIPKRMMQEGKIIQQFTFADYLKK